MENKQEDLIKFWTWTGFIKLDKKKWATPEHLLGEIMIVNHLPELNLDSIYACAIPKLQKEGYSITLIAYERNEFGAGIFDEVHDVSIATIDRADSPTEALYNAILKVIENDKT